METSPSTRVMLWTLPRSLSTPFVRWIGHGVANTQIIINPYATAHDVGPERVLLPDTVDKEILERWDQLHEDPNSNDAGLVTINQSECSYKFVKDLLEQDFGANKSVLFCKDFSYGLSGRFDMLPSGFKHTFLIRDPYKTFLSWRNLMQRCLEMKECFSLHVADALYPVLEGYKKSWELVEYLQEQGDDVIIVDADDMQQDPGAVLRMYCKRIGVDCLDSAASNFVERGNIMMMRDWISGRALLNQYGDRVETPREERFPSFQPPPKRHDVPFDILQYIDASMLYYLKMYKLRIML